MNGVVIDTDVVSYLLKDDTRAEYYRPLLKDQTLIVSFMTITEMDRWALVRQWGTTRRYYYEKFMEQFIIQSSSRNLCAIWADITEALRLQVFVLTCGDAWIAATAMQLNIPLVTHNARHYSAITGLSLITQTRS
jgi:predicted nucleic acid-binding protein